MCRCISDIVIKGCSFVGRIQLGQKEKADFPASLIHECTEKINSMCANLSRDLGPSD